LLLVCSRFTFAIALQLESSTCPCSLVLADRQRTRVVRSNASIPASTNAVDGRNLHGKQGPPAGTDAPNENTKVSKVSRLSQLSQTEYDWQPSLRVFNLLFHSTLSIIECCAATHVHESRGESRWGATNHHSFRELAQGRVAKTGRSRFRASQRTARSARKFNVPLPLLAACEAHLRGRGI